MIDQIKIHDVIVYKGNRYTILTITKQGIACARDVKVPISNAVEITAMCHKTLTTAFINAAQIVSILENAPNIFEVHRKNMALHEAVEDGSLEVLVQPNTDKQRYVSLHDLKEAYVALERAELVDHTDYNRRILKKAGGSPAGPWTDDNVLRVVDELFIAKRKAQCDADHLLERCKSLLLERGVFVDELEPEWWLNSEHLEHLFLCDEENLPRYIELLKAAREATFGILEGHRYSHDDVVEMLKRQTARLNEAESKTPGAGALVIEGGSDESKMMAAVVKGLGDALSFNEPNLTANPPRHQFNMLMALGGRAATEIKHLKQLNWVYEANREAMVSAMNTIEALAE